MQNTGNNPRNFEIKNKNKLRLKNACRKGSLKVYDDLLSIKQVPLESLTLQVTLVMCQTRFKITKEMSHEVYPPALRKKDCWFLHTIGNPDRFKCVLRAFIVMSSPVLSLVSTGLLLFGKIESNPYFFIPWLFLTIKGLVLVQTDNLITILRDMATKTNYAFGFRLEDLKWLFLYFTIFMIDLIETFSFCEIFDLFLVLWNHHPGYNIELANLEAVKNEIAEILENLSKCSLDSISKVSIGSLVDSDETDSEVKNFGSMVKFSLKDDEKIFDGRKPIETLLKRKNPRLKDSEQTYKKEAEKEFGDCIKIPSLNLLENNASNFSCLEFNCSVKSIANELSKEDITELTKKEKCEDLKGGKINTENTFLSPFHKEKHQNSMNAQEYATNILYP